MTRPDTEILSALVDGESVDPDVLAAALDDASARAALVDFVRLRNAVHGDLSPIPASLTVLRSTSRRRVLGWPAVAAALLLTFLAGWFAPRQFDGGSSLSAEGPPRPARVEKFVPGVDWQQSN